MRNMNEETKTALCPKCGKVYCKAPALSRVDNKALICPECGIRESLESIELDLHEQDEVLETIRRLTGQQTFPMGSVPITTAAKVYGKDSCWVRAGIISGWLPIGQATRNGKLVTDLTQMDSKFGRINYYISPKLLYEQTGYVWDGKER